MLLLGIRSVVVLLLFFFLFFSFFYTSRICRQCPAEIWFEPHLYPLYLRTHTARHLINIIVPPKQVSECYNH